MQYDLPSLEAVMQEIIKKTLEEELLRPGISLSAFHYIVLNKLTEPYT